MARRRRRPASESESQASPGILSRLGSGTLATLESSAIQVPLHILDTPRRIVAEAGNEFLRQVQPITPEDQNRSIFDSAKQIVKAGLKPSRAKAPSGFQVARGIRGGGSNWSNILWGAGLELGQDPTTFLGVGLGTRGARLVTATGQKVLKTAKGEGLFKQIFQKELIKGLTREVAELSAERKLMGLAEKTPGLIEKAGLTFTPTPLLPFGPVIKVKGTERAVEAAAQPFKSLWKRISPNSEAKSIIAETLHRERVRRGAQVAEQIRLAAPMLRAAAQKGDDPIGIMATITKAVEAPADTPAYLRALEDVPDYARPYVDLLKSSQKRFLKSEQYLGVSTSELGAAAKANIIKREMDLGNVVKVLKAAGGGLTDAAPKDRLSIYRSLEGAVSGPKGRAGMREMRGVERGIRGIERVEGKSKKVTLARVSRFINKYIERTMREAARKVERFHGKGIDTAKVTAKAAQVQSIQGDIRQIASGKISTTGLSASEIKSLKSSRGARQYQEQMKLNLSENLVETRADLRSLGQEAVAQKSLKGLKQFVQSVLPKEAWSEVYSAIDRLESSINNTVTRAAGRMKSARDVFAATRKEVDTVIDRIDLALKTEKSRLFGRQEAVGERLIATIGDEIQALKGELGDYDYFEHYLTPAFREFLDKNPTYRGISKIVTTSHASQLHRKLSKYDIATANLESKSGRLFPGFNEDIFVTDPRVIQITRVWKHIDTTNAAQLAMDLRKFGKFADAQEVIANPKLWTAFPYEHPSIPKGLLFPKEVADAVAKMRDKTRMAGSSWKVTKAFDAANNWFRKATLFPFPGTSVRNLVSAMFINAMEGSTNPQDYIQSFRAITNAHGTIDVGKWGKATYNDIRQWATEHGVIGGRIGGMEAMAGAMSPEDQLADLLLGSQGRVKFLGAPVEPKSFAGRIATGTSYAVGERNPVMRLGAYAMNFGDEGTRLAHFIARIKQGDTLEAASNSARKYLGSPYRLTHFENDYVNRTFFFYRWLRHNVPLQVVEAVRRPGRTAALLRLEAEAKREVMRPEDADFIPKFYQATMGIPYRYNKEKKSYEMLQLGGWLATADLGLLRIPFIDEPQGAVRFGLQQMSPLWTAGPDIATKGQFLRGEAARPRAGAYEVLKMPLVNPNGWLIEDPQWAPRIDVALRKVRLINTLDSMVDRPNESTGIRGSRALINYFTGIKPTELSIPRETFIAKIRKIDLMNSYRRRLREAIQNKDQRVVDSTVRNMVRDSGLPLEYFTRGY